jgi:hypothetical protein
MRSTPPCGPQSKTQIAHRTAGNSWLLVTCKQLLCRFLSYLQMIVNRKCSKELIKSKIVTSRHSCFRLAVGIIYDNLVAALTITMELKQKKTRVTRTRPIQLNNTTIM